MLRGLPGFLAATLALVLPMETLKPSLSAAGEPATPRAPTSEAPRGIHDFDFLVGRWTVQHRRLKARLEHNSDWETFPGTCETRLILGGQANVDDNVLGSPGGAYRAATVRVFDPTTKTWSIWWFDSRQPHDLDPPVVGGFHNGVGTFFADDRFKGKAIKVRFIWSDITPTKARWQQAFSEDAGATWETNWVMEFTRAE
jgi:hypothetical protein